MSIISPPRLTTKGTVTESRDTVVFNALLKAFCTPSDLKEVTALSYLFNIKIPQLRHALRIGCYTRTRDRLRRGTRAPWGEGLHHKAPLAPNSRLHPTQRRRPGTSLPSPRRLSAYTKQRPSSSPPACFGKPPGPPAAGRDGAAGPRPPGRGAGNPQPEGFPASQLPAPHRPSPRPHLPPLSFCFCFFVFLFASARPPQQDPPSWPAHRLPSPGTGSAAHRKAGRWRSARREP